MKEHYYFDNAATTWPKPETVYTTMDRFFRNYGVNPGRAGHELAVEAEKMIGETRRMLAAFFNYSGDPNRVVFTQNATRYCGRSITCSAITASASPTWRATHKVMSIPRQFVTPSRREPG